MPVARQMPSRLSQCGAKFARRAPTWDPSTLSGWGSCRKLARLLAAVWKGSVEVPLTVPARKGSSCVTVLWVVVTVGDPRQSKTDVLDVVFLDDVAFVLGLKSRCLWANVTDDSAILSAFLMVLKVFCRTLGSGPRTCEPSNGAVLTVEKTWGWNPKFCNKEWRRNNWRLEAMGVLSWNLLGPDTVLGQPQLLSRTQSVGPVTPAGPSKADESAGHVICRPVICWAVICQVVTCRAVTCRVIICWCCGATGKTGISRLDTKDNPDISLESWVVSLEF